MTSRNPRSATIPIHSGLNPLIVRKKAKEFVETVVLSLVVEGVVFGISVTLVPPLEAGDDGKGVMTIESVTSPVADN